MLEGKVVALDAEGRPSFNALQNGGAALHFFIVDLLVLRGWDVMPGETESLADRWGRRSR